MRVRDNYGLRPWVHVVISILIFLAPTIGVVLWPGEQDAALGFVLGLIGGFLGLDLLLGDGPLVRLPTDPDELRAYLSSLEVEHDFVHPDEIPGYWEAKARESGLVASVESRLGRKVAA